MIKKVQFVDRVTRITSIGTGVGVVPVAYSTPVEVYVAMPFARTNTLVTTKRATTPVSIRDSSKTESPKVASTRPESRGLKGLFSSEDDKRRIKISPEARRVPGTKYIIQEIDALEADRERALRPLNRVAIRVIHQKLDELGSELEFVLREHKRRSEFEYDLQV